MAAASATEISLASELTDGAISFDRLEQITDNFSIERRIGTGALGTVYRGILDDGGVIAVKRHIRNAPGTQNIEAYKRKVRSLMEHTHENVVRLLAFCIEKREEITEQNGTFFRQDVVESLLCYEYLHNGSLDKNLFGEEDSGMEWDTRFKTIKGICQGVKFLHKLPEPIVHLDLKPQNIMLDNNMVPKITDFAYSRVIGKENTRMVTKSSVGSLGYKAPEFLKAKEISARMDIYSLGVIILEITTREKNRPGATQESAKQYIDRVKDEWKTDEPILTEYPDLSEDCQNQIKLCIEIGLNCVDSSQNKRRRIVEIVKKLNG